MLFFGWVAHFVFIYKINNVMTEQRAKIFRTLNLGSSINIFRTYGKRVIFIGSYYNRLYLFNPVRLLPCFWQEPLNNGFSFSVPTLFSFMNQGTTTASLYNPCAFDIPTNQQRTQCYIVTLV